MPESVFATSQLTVSIESMPGERKAISRGRRIQCLGHSIGRFHLNLRLDSHELTLRERSRTVSNMSLKTS
jgi:hypothetical protein